MAEGRRRRKLGRFGKGHGGDLQVEIAIVEFEIDARDSTDLPREAALKHALRDIREGLPSLEDDLAGVVARDLGPGYRMGRIVVEEGSIVVWVSILAEAGVYYVAARQLLEYLRRDMRRLFGRWLGQHTHDVEVRHDVVIRRPPLLEAEERAERRRRRWRDDQLLEYLILSHAFLLVWLATASGFLLAHAL